MASMVSGMKRVARALTQRMPTLELPARRLQLEMWRNRVRWQARFVAAAPLANTLEVPPRMIQRAGAWSADPTSRAPGPGEPPVIAGSWDLVAQRFDDLEVYRAVEARVASGAPVEDPGGDIAVRVGRHGHFIADAGYERLAWAQHTGVAAVTARVTARHAAWVDLRREIEAYAREHSGAIYNVIAHPDLADIPALHGSERLGLIDAALPAGGGAALDIGCHWGYYCQRLEERGFRCVGIESEPRHVYFADRIRRAEQHTYDLVNCSIFEYDERRRFDLVLALYILHHLTKTEALHRQLVELLGRVEMKAMIFGCHNGDQPGMQTAYRNYSPDDFVAFLLASSNLTRARLIGVEEGRRNLYLLEA